MEFSIDFRLGRIREDASPPPVAETRLDTPLWVAIREFPLDHASASMPFTQRLARDHLWTEAYARKVVGEYRRFVYLAATETRMVTPSEDVDETWHLHLAYTRSYWDELCGKVLGRPLHHGPTGGSEDEAGYREAYGRTLSRYAEVFGAPAPDDVWPEAEQRFQLGAGFRTVPLRDFHLAGRLWNRRSDTVMALAFLGLWGLSVWGIWMAVGSEGPIFPIALLGLIPTIIVVERLGNGLSLPRWGKSGLGYTKYREPPKNDGSGGCGGCGGCG